MLHSNAKLRSTPGTLEETYLISAELSFQNAAGAKQNGRAPGAWVFWTELIHLSLNLGAQISSPAWLIPEQMETLP